MENMMKIIKSILYFIKWFIFHLKENLFRKRQIYNNKNVKLIAVGNGPSAKNFPFDKFKSIGYEICCVNFFALDRERFLKLKPKFYCCIDNTFNKDLSKMTSEEKKLVEILNSVDWPMNFICFKKHLPINNSNIRFHYINTNEYKGNISKFKCSLYNKNIATHGYQNVMLAVLFYAVSTKFSEVCLTGVENDWHRELFVEKDNSIYRITKHFYGEHKINVTIEENIKKGELYKYFKYYYITLYNYYLNAQYAKRNNVKIINTCTQSYIDVYEKKDVDELYEND